MRVKMDRVCNFCPVKCLDDSLNPLKHIRAEEIDFVVVRENTEGAYVDVGGVFKQGTPQEIAVNEDVNTRTGVEGVIRYAFELAKRTGRKKVLMSDKWKVMT